MSFSRFALFFKQDFVGGYRYLDQCGEFLVRAQDDMDMQPSGDQTPSGGNLEKPEVGLKLEVNTTMLRLSQELPDESEGETYIRHAEYFANLYQELFRPRAVERNGVALQCYLPFSDVAQAERASLSGAGAETEALGRHIGMLPESYTREYRYVSGSRRLRVKAHPATFERVQGVLKTPPSRSTASKRALIERQNTGARRLLEKTLQHALFVEFDLTEDMPPLDGVRSLLVEVLEKQAQLLPVLFPQFK